MDENYITPEAPQKKSNTALIIIIVVLVLLCCCCVLMAGLAWNYGDYVLELLGFTY